MDTPHDPQLSDAGESFGPPPPRFAESEEAVPPWMRWSWALGLVAAVVSLASVLLTLRVLDFLRA